MANQLGSGMIYILSQLMQKRLAEAGKGKEDGGREFFGDPAPENSEPGETGQKYFAADETGAAWERHTDLHLLKEFCREGYGQALRHGHFLIGTCEGKSFIAVPGRFLLEDQPAGGKTGFTLWQPLMGGEAFYGGLEEMDEDTAKHVYGYWIAALDSSTLEISEV